MEARDPTSRASIFRQYKHIIINNYDNNDNNDDNNNSNNNDNNT